MILAITNGTIIDGRGSDPLVGILLVEQEHIIALGRKDQVAIPRDATVIDAMGGSILPGLIDCHVHFMLEHHAWIDHTAITTPFAGHPTHASNIRSGSHDGP